MSQRPALRPAAVPNSAWKRATARAKKTSGSGFMSGQGAKGISTAATAPPVTSPELAAPAA